MKQFLSLVMSICALNVMGQLQVQEVGNLPVSVSNNAVCEGFINGVPYVYSFAGIDSTKQYSGIHLQSFRYNTLTEQVDQLPDLPDTLGKIAAAASRVGDTIYISGGYHVFANGSELSSDKMHRYDINNNVFLADGASIPVATDDHVQVVWRDSLIYLITGWHNTANIPDVQIYNPYLDSWQTGTELPNNHFYKSFGASGVILGDTIYYFGGAKSIFGFGIQSELRKGVINPSDPTDITWSFTIPNATINGYRMAATTVGPTMHWLGGSTVTYNYDGIAYNGSGGVEPSNRDVSANPKSSHWFVDYVTEMPMDLRGIAEVNDSVKYLAGGMIGGQTVTNKIYKLEWDMTFLKTDQYQIPKVSIYPNPTTDYLTVDLKDIAAHTVRVFSMTGEEISVIATPQQTKTTIDISELPKGLYVVSICADNYKISKKIIKN